MDFWLVSTLLTFVAILIVMLPLTRKNTVADAQSDEDRSVYIQQLKEVDADLARGLLDEQSAEQARLEISRRILQNDRKQAHKTAPQTKSGESGSKDYVFSRSARFAIILILLFIPAVSWGLYAMTGSPDLPSQPLAERRANTVQDQKAAELIAQAEAHLAKTPDDGRGWAILAPIYLRLGRVDDAINAYRKALQLLGDDAERLIGLGEALIVKANGAVTQEALGLFEKAAMLEPSDLRPPLMQARFYMQAGKRDEAIAVLQKMLDTAPENAPWRADIEQAIANMKSGRTEGAPAGNAVAPQAPVAQPGPTQADIEAAAQLDEQGRKDMIRSMVDGLAEKLRENPSDAAGWERLIRAYMVLGEREKALEAVGTAVKSLPEEDAKRLREAAAQSGLDVSGVVK